MSNIDTNVNMGDVMSTHEAQGIWNVSNSSIPVSIITSSTFETTFIDTSTSLPPFHSPLPTSLSPSTISHIYVHVMDRPITSLFSSQSTDGPKSISEVEQDDDDYMVSFSDI